MVIANAVDYEVNCFSSGKFLPSINLEVFAEVSHFEEGDIL